MVCHKAEALRSHRNLAFLMWFCYVRGSFVPEPLQSLNTGVFFSEHSLENPRALRSSHQVRVWEGGQSLGALRGEPDPVLWCPSSWGPRALEEGWDAVRPSPSLPCPLWGLVLVRTDEEASETEPATHINTAPLC